MPRLGTSGRQRSAISQADTKTGLACSAEKAMSQSSWKSAKLEQHSPQDKLATRAAADTCGGSISIERDLDYLPAARRLPFPHCLTAIYRFSLIVLASGCREAKQSSKCFG